MSNSMIVFRFPDGTLASVPGEELAAVPEKGGFYLLDGNLYEVSRTVECLGPHNGDGKLIELLKHVLESEDPSNLARIRNLGAGKATGLISTPDRVLLAELRAVRRAQVVRLEALAPLKQLQASTDRNPVPALRAGRRARTGQKRSSPRQQARSLAEEPNE